MYFDGLLLFPKHLRDLQMCQDCMTQPLVQAHVLPYKARVAYYYVTNATFGAVEFSGFSESVGEFFRLLKIRKQLEKTQT